MTEWRPIPDYEGFYEVSDQGDVRSLRSGQLRALTPHNDDGRLWLNLFKNGRRRTHFLHNLLLSAFVGPRPLGMLGCHNDGDCRNNHLDNLRWDTPASNQQDAVRHGTHAAASKTHCVRGHAFDEENTHTRPDGYRLCRACNAARSREVYRARKAAAS